MAFKASASTASSREASREPARPSPSQACSRGILGSSLAVLDERCQGRTSPALRIPFSLVSGGGWGGLPGRLWGADAGEGASSATGACLYLPKERTEGKGRLGAATAPVTPGAVGVWNRGPRSRRWRDSGAELAVTFRCPQREACRAGIFGRARVLPPHLCLPTCSVPHTLSCSSVLMSLICVHLSV